MTNCYNTIFLINKNITKETKFNKKQYNSIVTLVNEQLGVLFFKFPTDSALPK